MGVRGMAVDKLRRVNVINIAARVIVKDLRWALKVGEDRDNDRVTNRFNIHHRVGGSSQYSWENIRSGKRLMKYPELREEVLIT